PESILVIVGEGEERKKIERLIAKRKLEDKVLLLGKRDDIPELLSAFDAFVMPSIFEGLGTAGIEAQAADLRCFFSTGVPLEAKVLDDCEFIPLSEPASYWASRICEVESDGVRGNRLKNNRQALFDAGYCGTSNIFSWLDGFLKQ
ncbi:MAG: glycosyltransferase family 1 protein, partial [Actinobacteria bacterium]|nr:glycosyltransferase family 1 protein [Actinomycetota bacterium]